MSVGLCHRVTDAQISEAVDQGAHHLSHLEESCGLGTGGGRCRDTAQQLIDSQLAEANSYAA